MKLLRVRCLEFELLGESFCCEGLCVFEFVNYDFKCKNTGN